MNSSIHDMNQIEIEEKKGKFLSQEVIKFMVDHRIREYGENTKDFENNEQESVFFFLKDGNEIKAFGMLKPIKISYDSKEYEIMGMANVIALEKGKGLGTILMNHVKKYLDKNNFSCIGNTYKDNFDFYKKCGFTFIPGLLERFVDIDKEGKRLQRDWTDYRMFIYDDNHSLDEVVKGSNEIVVKIPLW